MPVVLVTLNSFLEDTCVLVATAFVVVRGPFERLTQLPVWMGLLAGALGASEAFFPGARFPYGPHILAATFATAAGGPIAGAISALVILAVAWTILPLASDLAITVQVLTTIAMVAGMRKFLKGDLWAVGLCVAGQIIGIGVSHTLKSEAPESLTSFISVPANAFGLLLLGLVVHDARVRSDTVRVLHESIEARRVAAEAQLVMLRSRIQPHFLFNALNSIAALCTIAPKQASEATIQLGRLMRRSLEIDFGTGLTLGEELETVQAYLAIEQERFGNILRVSYDIDGAEKVIVPAFGVQILVENAVLHGITRRTGGGEVKIMARKNSRGWTIAVVDTGVGLSKPDWTRATPHGLGILRAQLRASHGHGGNLHLLARESGGALAAFCVPFAGRRTVAR